MSYNPKTKIIESDKVIIDGEEFCLVSKENEKLNGYNNSSKIENKEDKKSELVIALVVGAIILALVIWIILEPVNAILNVMLFGIPAILVIKCILAMLLPPKPKNYDMSKKDPIISPLWWD